MVDIKTHTSEIGRIINLSEVETSEALQTASLCETIKVRIHNLTPSQGPVTIPVRYTREDSYMLPIGYLEDVVRIQRATKVEFRILREIYNLLNS